MQAMGVEAGAQVPPNPLGPLANLPVPGTPGTRSDLALRVIEFVSTMLAVVAMASANDFSTVDAFIFLLAAASLQALWSFSHVVAIITHHYPLHQHWMASKIMFGDVITSTLTLCAASAAGGVVLYLHTDMHTCATMEHCTKFENTILRAFISLLAVVPSLVVNYIIR